jgi:hypothetical protein
MEDQRPKKTIDPKTGILPISEWGAECARGFVSNARFSGGRDKVIAPTNRTQTKKFRSSVENSALSLRK